MNFLLKPLEQGCAPNMQGKATRWFIERVKYLGDIFAVEIPRIDVHDQMFPPFQHVYPQVRDLIRQCTTGAAGWQGRSPRIARSELQLVLFESADQDKRDLNPQKTHIKLHNGDDKKRLRRSDGIRKRIRDA